MANRLSATRRGRVREPAPVRADLKRHDDPGDDAHAERHREYLDPKRRDAEVDLAAGGEMEALQDRYERCEADGESRQEEVKGDDPGELHPGKHNRIQAHLDAAFPLRPLRPHFGRGVTVSLTVTISMTLLGGLPVKLDQNPRGE